MPSQVQEAHRTPNRTRKKNLSVSFNNENVKYIEQIKSIESYKREVTSHIWDKSIIITPVFPRRKL